MVESCCIENEHEILWTDDIIIFLTVGDGNVNDATHCGSLLIPFRIHISNLIV